MTSSGERHSDGLSNSGAPRTARRRGAAGANARFRQCSLWVDMRILAMTVRAVTAAEGVSGTREYGRRASNRAMQNDSDT
jgi:hypothetical protein